MRCGRCGRELDGDGRCGYCSGEARSSPSPVRVLSREEEAAYDGITIDETPEGMGAEGPRFGQRRGPGHPAGDCKNWLQWVIGGVFVAALLAFLFFIALPVAVVLAAVAVIVWFFRGFFQGH